MKIVITESQLEFIRRYKVLDGLVSAVIELVSSQDDVCDYSFSDFFEEIKWQVSDKYEMLDLPKDLDPGIIQDWVSDNFYDQIKNYYDVEITPRCEEEYNNNDDDDEDYYSGLLYCNEDHYVKVKNFGGENDVKLIQKNGVEPYVGNDRVEFAFSCADGNRIELNGIYKKGSNNLLVITFQRGRTEGTSLKISDEEKRRLNNKYFN
jgi:hypothetical protein